MQTGSWIPQVKNAKVAVRKNTFMYVLQGGEYLGTDEVMNTFQTGNKRN